MTTVITYHTVKQSPMTTVITYHTVKQSPMTTVIIYHTVQQSPMTTVIAYYTVNKQSPMKFFALYQWKGQKKKKDLKQSFQELSHALSAGGYTVHLLCKVGNNCSHR
jgi:hypothetical protein